MKKILPLLILASASLLIAMPHAFAQTASATTQKTTKPVAKKTTAKSKAANTTESRGNDGEGSEPDITKSTGIDFQCELGNQLTIYKTGADEKSIALRWKKRLHQLSRVETSTGADRFEDRRNGLVWIGIPAKGMLLDSKKGQQLANECKNREQIAMNTTNTNAPSMLGAPASSAPPAKTVKTAKLNR